MKQQIASLPEQQKKGYAIEKLPFTIRILLENALRHHDDFAVTQQHIDTLRQWNPNGSGNDVPYKPSRVLMQDFTGVPAIVDVASIRSEVIRQGKDGEKINPSIPVDLVTDHSVQVDYFGTEDAYKQNVAREYERNKERYQLLKWGQQFMDNFTVVPPGMGICHQVNLEYLAQGVTEREGWAFPDTLVGTDSHTPMVNGIGVLGWGVGGIEAEAAILGQPIYFLCPQVIGLRVTGKLQEGVTATDMVLTITKLLREYGVVGKFVEVFGDGLDNLTVPDRATISNMSPEFGCTVTYFPIDDQTLDYMKRTSRSQEQIDFTEQYCKENMLWRENEDAIEYTDVLELNLSEIEPAVAGPKRPQDKIEIKDLKDSFKRLLEKEHDRSFVNEDERTEDAWLYEGGSGTEYTYEPRDGEIDETGVQVETRQQKTIKVTTQDAEYKVSDGAVAIAAITSCTNTSNPSVMLGAGLVAQKAIQHGLDVKPWVKTSLAPGSQVVTDYLQRSGLLEDLQALRFHLVGYGCTTCIGNSGPLPPEMEKAASDGDLVLSSVLSGNRNFEARVHPQVKMNFLASPMLVVAYAIAGRVDINLLEEPVAHDPNGQAVYLKDIWPSQAEINQMIQRAVDQKDYQETYAHIFEGEEQWQQLEAPNTKDYQWGDDSTYIKEAPFFKHISREPEPITDIKGARALLKVGDSVTTDHISPAGAIKHDSPAGRYLEANGVALKDFNSYGSRRGNHEVMVRGTFANVRIKNQLASQEGGYTTHIPTGEEMYVYDAAMRYREENTPLVVLAGKEYGTGSSRDWAAKGTKLLGVRAVIADTYERIHRSNLVGMGVLPLQFLEGENAETLGLTGTEAFNITGIADNMVPGKLADVEAVRDGQAPVHFQAQARLDSDIEVAYYRNGGILNYVLRQFLNRN